MVQAGELRRLVEVSVFWDLLKPVEYFDVAWRRERHVGGPLLIILVHELDCESSSDTSTAEDADGGRDVGAGEADLAVERGMGAA